VGEASVMLVQPSRPGSNGEGRLVANVLTQQRRSHADAVAVVVVEWSVAERREAEAEWLQQRRRRSAASRHGNAADDGGVALCCLLSGFD